MLRVSTKFLEFVAVQIIVKHPPQSGWLDECDHLKGGRLLNLGVALRRAFVADLLQFKADRGGSVPASPEMLARYPFAQDLGFQVFSRSYREFRVRSTPELGHIRVLYRHGQTFSGLTGRASGSSYLSYSAIAEMASRLEAKSITGPEIRDTIALRNS